MIQNVLKKAHTEFDNLALIVPNPSNCIQPTNYLNISERPIFKFYGFVKNEDGVPIKDAVIYSNDNSTVLTDDNGRFDLYNDGSAPFSVYISGYGYEAITINNYSNGFTHTLKKINRNNWTKRYTNNSNNKFEDWIFSSSDRILNGDLDNDGKDELLIIQVNSSNVCKASMYAFDNGVWIKIWSNNGNNAIGEWSIKSFDKFLLGDFDGDGKQELQCLQLTNGSNNWATTLKFVNGIWQRVWSNNGISSFIGGWGLKSFDEFVVGNYDLDNRDEILCWQKTDISNSWANVIHYDNNTWNMGWSNFGNDKIGEWTIKASDVFKSGDLNGDNKDDLLCTQNGGTNDWITFLTPNTPTWSRLWSNNGSPNVGIYPYRSNLIIGNFDTDSRDEILGISTWATKFDFNTGSNSPDWTWSTSGSRLSDWQVSPNSFLTFFHGIEVAPDYLLTLQNINNNFTCEMFSHNEMIQGNGTYLRTKNEGDLHDITKSSIHDSKLIIYPQPANDLINLFVKNYKENSFIEIFDIKGNLLKKVLIFNSVLEVDCSEFQSGIYLIRAETNMGFLIDKFIISN